LAGKRYCTLDASRTCASEKDTKFNTTVYWESKIDTVWYNEDEKYLVRTDTVPTYIAEQTVKLKKRGKTGDRSMIMYSIPKNVDYWAIWIATGANASQNFADTEKKMAQSHPYVNKKCLMSALALN